MFIQKFLTLLVLFLGVTPFVSCEEDRPCTPEMEKICDELCIDPSLSCEAHKEGIACKVVTSDEQVEYPADPKASCSYLHQFLRCQDEYAYCKCSPSNGQKCGITKSEDIDASCGE